MVHGVDLGVGGALCDVVLRLLSEQLDLFVLANGLRLVDGSWFAGNRDGKLRDALLGLSVCLLVGSTLQKV